MQLGAIGCNWVQMGADGCRWVQMGADGYRWVQMGAGGCRWVQMGADGCRWLQMVAFEHIDPSVHWVAPSVKRQLEQWLMLVEASMLHGQSC